MEEGKKKKKDWREKQVGEDVENDKMVREQMANE